MCVSSHSIIFPLPIHLHHCPSSAKECCLAASPSPPFTLTSPSLWNLHLVVSLHDRCASHSCIILSMAVFLTIASLFPPRVEIWRWHQEQRRQNMRGEAARQSRSCFHVSLWVFLRLILLCLVTKLWLVSEL